MLISTLLDWDVRGIRALAHRLPGWLLPKPEEACIIRTGYAFWLQIDPVKDDGVERSLYYTGTYEKGVLAIMAKVLGAGDHFVDVGANIGLMSIYASLLVGDEGRVTAFEPNPETAAILEENIALNECPNIKVSRMAMGSKAGKAVIYDNWDSNRGSASLVKPEQEAGSHEIQVGTLSEFFTTSSEENAANRVGFPGRKNTLIKLDIEGYELEALKGAGDILNADRPPMLVVECSETRENEGGYTPTDLYNFLTSAGRYRIFTGRKDKSRVSRLVEITSPEDLPMHDNIWCFTPDHIRQLDSRIFH